MVNGAGGSASTGSIRNSQRLLVNGDSMLNGSFRVGRSNSTGGRTNKRSNSNAGVSSSTILGCCALAALVGLRIQMSLYPATYRELTQPLREQPFIIPNETPSRDDSQHAREKPSETKASHLKSTKISAKFELPKGSKIRNVPYQPRVIRLKEKGFSLPVLRSTTALPPPDETEDETIILIRSKASSAGTTGNTSTTNEINVNDNEGAAVEVNNDEEVVDECVPMAKWQSSVPVNCNTLHEVDLMTSIVHTGEDGGEQKTANAIRAHHHINNKTVLSYHPEWKESQLKFLGQGWFRAAWKLDRQPPGGIGDDEDGDDETIILKMLRPERDFTDEFYELHRIDAVAMEQLTHSQYVLNTYGYCGQSALNEFASFKIPELSSLEKFDRQLRGKVDPRIDRMKLKLAVSVASGVAHMHELPADLVGHQRPTMAHYDLNPRNVAIVKGGQPKLNDFNVAHFLKWNPRTNRTCGFDSRLHEPWWRAPEEVSLTDSGNLTNAIDVYSLGNLLFHILTSHSPRGKMTKERMDEVRQDVLKGIRPTVPKPYADAKDPASVAILKAMERCFAKNPSDRGTAREIADDLLETYSTMMVDEEGTAEKLHALPKESAKMKKKKKKKKHK